MRVLVCGDRNWTNYESIEHELALLLCPGDVVIEGEARGADSLAARYVGCHSLIGLLAFPADWTKKGKAAGPIRNQQMLTEGKPDLVLAFHADIEHSKGTKDIVSRARHAGIPVKVITE